MFNDKKHYITYIETQKKIEILKKTSPSEFNKLYKLNTKYIFLYPTYKKNILYYKFTALASLFFYELNNRYDLIHAKSLNIVEINNKSLIADAYVIIKDRLQLDNKINVIYPKFMSGSSDVTENAHYSRTGNSSNIITCNDKDEYDRALDAFDGVDFIYIDIVDDNYDVLDRLIDCDVLNVGANAVLLVGNNVDLHRIAKCCSFFDEFFITYSETIGANTDYVYLVLKSKKQHKGKLDNKIKVSELCVITYTKLYMELINMNNSIIHMSAVAKFDAEKIKEYNLYSCIRWSQKYGLSLLDNIGIPALDDKLKQKILKELFDDRQILLTFQKSNGAGNIVNLIDTNTDFTMIPDSFKEMQKKFYYEIRAIDYRDLTVYHNVKLKLDPYYKKITKIISHDFNLHNDYISQAWLKMTEILHETKLLKNMQTVNTFHICELPGAFINAIKFYVNNHTKILKWEWVAQSLNPELTKHVDIKDKTKLKAFDDEAGLLKRFPNRYDFGPKNTGDVTDTDNIQYYAKKYTNIDLVTADCGVSIMMSEYSHKLSFATYVFILALLKKGGNSLIKRYIPINNNQEIFMIYLYYLHFEKLIFYKPLLNPQSQEYYIVGIGYRGISPILLDKLYGILNNTISRGIIDISNIDHTFLETLDKYQNIIQDNMNSYIRKKIYFTDNFDTISESDWKNIENNNRVKLNNWIKKYMHGKF